MRVRLQNDNSLFGTGDLPELENLQRLAPEMDNAHFGGKFVV